MATTQVRISAADRREQILNIATGLFAQQGFQGTTTREVAHRAGVTEALIFRHFPSKEDLYWAVIESKLSAPGLPGQLMRERIEAGGSDRDIFARIAAQIIQKRADDQTLSRLLLYSALENHRLSHRFFRTYMAENYEVLSEYIRKGIAGGRFRRIDPLLAARGFMGMVIYHSWVQELFGGKRVQDFPVEQAGATMADLWLRGMIAGPAASGSGNGTKTNGNHRRSRRKQEHAGRQ